MAEIYCNNCGHQNPDGSRFCSSCGRGLEDDSRGDERTMGIEAVVDADTGPPDEYEIVADAAEVMDELPSGVGLLVVQRGPGAGSRFSLEAPTTTAGRHPKSDIFLDDVTVSRRHAEVINGTDGYVVVDCGSLNGTYLNRERIEGQVALANGDEVQIGRFKLVFLADGRSE